MANPCYPSQVKKFPFTQEEIASIWKYTRDNYVDKGKDFESTIKGVATDLGLHPNWIADALTKPKAIRGVTNEMYSKMAKRRQIINEAKDMVRGINTPPLKKIWQTIYRTPFAVAVAGHGTVGMQTHVGAALFRPSTWNTYFSNFGRQFKYSLRPAIHEAAIQDLVRRDNYVLAKRAGLANDPSVTYTDYGTYAKWIPKVLGKNIGQRGFDVLKVYRQDAFDHEWARIPESIKSDPIAAKDMAENISEMVNHSSGVIGSREHGIIANTSKTASPIAFAARLEASRWSRILGDPIKTVNTFANWKNASAAERSIALTRVRHAAEFAGFYYTTLLANNALLATSGSNDRVNLTDPTRSDWLKHKVAGRTLALEGNLIAPVRLLAKLVYDFWGERKQMNKREPRYLTAGKDVLNYGRSKLAPAAGIITDLTTGEDFMGNVMPGRSDKPRKNKHRLTVAEYTLQHGPIPLAGGTREVYDDFRDQGMSAATATNLLRGLAVFGMEMTGAKIGHEPKSKITSFNPPP